MVVPNANPPIAAESIDPYIERDGIFRPPVTITHRDDEDDSRGFELLERMRGRHFWDLGRRRFVLESVCRRLKDRQSPRPPLRVIDLGGGVGGWIEYLVRSKRFEIAEQALSDSSEAALRRAAPILPPKTSLYQIDLLDLHWRDRWDLAFMLDVLEHIPEQEAVLAQVRDALAPGGLLFVTVPALKAFWSWNDEAVGHQRRYARADFQRLADASGLRLLDARYFMFLLSPLLWLGRQAGRPSEKNLSREELWNRVERAHRLPSPPVNSLLSAVFTLETPMGHMIRFPWGTSLLAVLQKPADADREDPSPPHKGFAP